MTPSKVDWPSFLFGMAFTINMIICFYDPFLLPISRETGIFLFIGGILFFIWVLPYLKSGFFGDTSPKLPFLVKNGPYRFFRHPLYLSFILMILGIDLMLKSILGLTSTILLSIPSAIYRAKVEDVLLNEKFGEEWENYAKKVGMLFPRFKRCRKNE